VWRFFLALEKDNNQSINKSSHRFVIMFSWQQDFELGPPHFHQGAFRHFKLKKIQFNFQALVLIPKEPLWDGLDWISAKLMSGKKKYYLVTSLRSSRRSGPSWNSTKQHRSEFFKNYFLQLPAYAYHKGLQIHALIMLASQFIAFLFRNKLRACAQRVACNLYVSLRTRSQRAVCSFWHAACINAALF
jgi:hypothetical protein